MSSIQSIAQLPTPVFIEALDYEQILKELRDLFGEKMRASGLEPSLLESDPAIKLLDVAAYRELLLRNRINLAGKSLLLAYAVGADLDHIAATYYNGEERFLLTPADDTASPPKAAVYESDADFRARLLTIKLTATSGGTASAYNRAAREAAPTLRSIGIGTPEGGVVDICLLADTVTGVPDRTTLDAVTLAVNHDKVRAICDTVRVRSATIFEYQITLDVSVKAGHNSTDILRKVRTACAYFAEQYFVCGGSFSLSELVASAHIDGVAKVVVVSPSADISCAYDCAPRCTLVDIRLTHV